MTDHDVVHADAPATVDWEVLRAAARVAAGAAHAPYSGYPVGASGLTEDGQVISGCNVENASYGLTLCAECGLVSELVRRGGGRLVAVVALHPDHGPIPPCGRCRQLLREFAAPGMLVDGPDGPVSLDDLLPWSFGPEHLTTEARP